MNRNIRFAHHQSYTPIFELSVAPAITLATLRGMIEDRFCTEDHCLMRCFTNWFFEVKVGSVAKLIEITSSDDSHSLAALGIEDETIIYLEGTLYENSETSTIDIACLNKKLSVQSRAIEARMGIMEAALQTVTAQLSKEVSSMKTEIANLKSKLDVASNEATITKAHVAKLESQHAAQNGELVKEIASLRVQIQSVAEAQPKALAAESATNAKRFEALDTELKRLETNIPKKVENDIARNTVLRTARTYLSNYPPSLAFFTAITDGKESSDVALAIAEDPRCGMERKATPEDGEMQCNHMMINNASNGTTGMTPLLIAAAAGRADVVIKLLDRNANIRATIASGVTALHVAAFCDCPEVIKVLVQIGMSPDTATDPPFFNTPLHSTALHGSLRAAEALVKLGASKAQRNGKGQTASDRWRESESKFCFDLDFDEQRKFRQLLSP